MSVTAECTIECERQVDCTECGMRKHPVGRDPGIYTASSYCPHECPGHDKEPRPGHLWPGELRRERERNDDADE